MELTLVLQTWIMALMMIFTFTFLHSENPLYRIAEHIYVGAATGNLVVVGLESVYRKTAAPISQGDVTMLVPIILGVLMFTTFSKKQYWPARYAVSLIVGVGVGLALRATPKAQIINQIAATVSIIGKDAFSSFNALVVWLAVFATVGYFLFTFERKGALGSVAKIGRYFILTGLGVTYASGMVTKTFMLVYVMDFLLQPASLSATLVGLLLATAVLWHRRKKAK